MFCEVPPILCVGQSVQRVTADLCLILFFLVVDLLQITQWHDMSVHSVGGHYMGVFSIDVHNMGMHSMNVPGMHST
jgi:hypothetical protein